MIFRIKQMLLCCGVVVLFVGLMELVERSSSHYQMNFYPQSHILRYAAGAVIHWGREGYGTTTIGPEGMIVNKSLGPGTRVMFLGDSFTEALQVDDAEKFTELVPATYNQQSPQSPITTLNFAFSGHSAVQYAADLPGLSRRWQPQIVIVQLSPFDFTASDVTLRTNNQTARLATQADGQWVIENALPPPPASRKQRLTQKLADWHLFSTLARISWRMNQFLGNAAPPESQETANPPATPNAAATVVTNPEETQYRARVQWLLNQLRETCQANGARLVVLHTPRAPQFEAGHIRHDESWQGPVYLRQRAILEETCAALRVPFWNPLPALDDFVQQTGRLPFGFANNTPGQGHLNPDGHRVLAAFLTAQLSAQFVEPGTSPVATNSQ